MRTLICIGIGIGIGVTEAAPGWCQASVQGLAGIPPPPPAQTTSPPTATLGNYPTEGPPPPSRPVTPAAGSAFLLLQQPEPGELPPGALLGWAAPPPPTRKSGVYIDSLDASLQENAIFLDGDRGKFEQYGTPSQGIGIPRLWTFAGHPGDGWLAMDLRQPGRGDENLFVQYFTPWRSGPLRFFNNSAQEHPELNSLEVDRVSRGIGLNQPIVRGVRLLGHVIDRSFTPTTPNAVYLDRPRLPYANYTLRGGDVGLVVPRGPISLAIREGAVDFNDRTGNQPSNTTHQVTAELRSTLSSRVSGTASYSYINTDVQSRPGPFESEVGHTNHEGVARVDLQATPVDSLSLRGYYRNNSATRNFNLSGYAQQVNTGGLRLAWNGIPNLMVRTGYEYRSIDYLNFNHTATLNPKVQTVFLSGRYRPLRVIEITGRVSDLRRMDLPPSPNFETMTLETPVSPREKLEFQSGLSYTPSALYGISFQFDQVREDNSPRGVVPLIRFYDVAAWAQPFSRLSLTATYGLHQFSSTYLSPYLSNDEVVSGGFAYTLTSRAYLNASYTQTLTSNAVSAAEHGFDISTHYQLSRANELIFEVTGQNFMDDFNSLTNYQATGVTFRWRRRVG